MNLVTKTNRYFVILILIVFPVMVLADYLLIQYFANKEVEEILLHESERIKYNLSETGVITPSNYLIKSHPVNKEIIKSNQYRDTLIFEAYKGKLIPHRIYEFTTEVDQQKVNVALKHPLLEVNNLIIWLFLTTTFVFTLMVFGLFFINQKIYQWTWKPFFKKLSILKNYDITKKNPIVLESSDIREFDEFRLLVSTLMDQVKKDFENLKEFNENISHEIQTPMAIIRNKIVLLLESKNLDDKEYQWVQSVYQETNKLSRIGKSLTLISRIENQEFKRLDEVDLSTMISNIINNMEEIINYKRLDVQINLSPIIIKCDQILANILFTNFIKNAVQHNHENGFITINLNAEGFEIINSGDDIDTETSKLFNRFQKANKTTDSLGLGLAINSRICDLYGWQLKYDSFDHKHVLKMLFGNSLSNN